MIKRQNVLAFESDMAAHRLEQAAQHEADDFGILDRLAMADRHQNLGHFVGEALVLEMLGPQPG